MSADTRLADPSDSRIDRLLECASRYLCEPPKAQSQAWHVHRQQMDAIVAGPALRAAPAPEDPLTDAELLAL